MPHLVYSLEKLRELRQQIYNLAHYNDTELHPLALAPEGFNNELQCYFLQSAIDNPVLDDRSVELRYLLEVLSRVLVQEAVLIEEGMQHASIYLLFLFDVGASELLHQLN